MDQRVKKVELIKKTIDQLVKQEQLQSNTCHLLDESSFVALDDDDDDVVVDDEEAHHRHQLLSQIITQLDSLKEETGPDDQMNQSTNLEEAPVEAEEDGEKEAKVIVVPKDMRENLLHPLYGTNHMHIKIMNRTIYSVEDVVDSLLWISPQVDTLSVDQGRSLQSLIKVIVVPKEMRENLNPPLYATNGFDVDTNNLVKHSVVDVLDSLLWISPQLNNLIFDHGKKTLKFLYRDVADEDVTPCCASLPRKCWRHKVDKVKLRNFTCTELQMLRNYFSTNADILDIIEVPEGCKL